MRICIVHNEYGAFSGEEAVVRAQQEILTDNGHHVIPFTRSSAAIKHRPLGRTRAFFTGIYNPFAQRTFARLLHEHKIDLVHIHNLYPLISPAILPVCRRAGVPVAMSVHNFRLMCPIGLFLQNGSPCRRCAEGSVFNCIRHNCTGNIPKSIGYALRHAVARHYRLFTDNVDLFLPVSQAVQAELIAAGISPARSVVQPNPVTVNPAVDTPLGDYVGFVGRLSPEKGLNILLAAARHCPDIPFRIAGPHHTGATLPDNIPANVEFVGSLTTAQLPEFYRSLRFLVVPSLCPETFGLTAAEAQAHAKPVIASHIGALPEIVIHQQTGLLVTPNDPVDLSENIKALWTHSDQCRQLGANAHRNILSHYHPQAYYQRLMHNYQRLFNTAAAPVPTTLSRNSHA